MSAYVPQGDLILICPKGPDYSEESDVVFKEGYQSSRFIRHQVAKEMVAAWRFNAKVVRLKHTSKIETSTGQTNESVPIEGLYYRADFFDHGNNDFRISFADEYTFPEGFSDGLDDPSVNLTTGSLVFSGNFYKKEELHQGIRTIGRFFYHRTNWYFHQLTKYDKDDPHVTRTHTNTNDKITLVEVYVTDPNDFGATSTTTTTTTWTITEKFYP